MNMIRALRGERRLVFLIDLLQDVSMLRPLIRMSAQDLKTAPDILISDRFIKRDTTGAWQAELDAVVQETEARRRIYAAPHEAVQIIQGGHGLLLSSSESNLSAHRVNHEVFRAAPSSFLRVTIQHGFECPGFLHNHDHDLAWGKNVAFAADVLCGWGEASVLRSLAAAERDKLVVTGAPLLLQLPTDEPALALDAGLICENLHSVRMQMRGDFRTSFMDVFAAFSEQLAASGDRVVLRPHPAGQFVIKNKVELPPNVLIENRPSYRVPFGRYAFGISAPSSVLFDMVLSGTPTAIYQDEGGVLDVGNYTGLPVVRTPDEWMAFREDAFERRETLLEGQRAFLSGMRMPLDVADVRNRFLRLLGGTPEIRASAATAQAWPKRVIFISNAFIPTLQLSFVKPLAALEDEGRITLGFADEAELKERFGTRVRSAEAFEAMKQKIDAFAPDLMVFCRYSGPHAEALVAHARSQGVPTIFHVDDDLLNVPKEIGEQKWKMHNQPTRLKTVRHLLSHTDLVYNSTGPLLQRFRALGFTTPMTVGQIYCAGAVLNRAELRPVRRIGYMGFDHAHDFQLAVPALIRYLDRHPEVEFELFGSIPKPPEFNRFGERFRLVPPVREYAKFLEYFASLNWDIGICPLADTPFNEVKANTKWVEYTSVGAAVIATRGTIYDGCTADGCGMLASSEDEWLEALERLTADPRARFEMVSKAQRRLEEDYSVAALRQQVLGVFAEARRHAEALASRQPGTAPKAPAPGRKPALAGETSLGGRQ